MALGGPPQPTTKWEILFEDTDGDAVRFGVRHSHDHAALGLETRGELVDGVWKVVEVTQLAS